MMNALFLRIVNMSIAATYIALAVLLLRMLFKKAPKWSIILMWGLLALRLVIPFSFESALSLIPSGEIVSPEILVSPEPAIHSGLDVVNKVVNPVLADKFAPDPVSHVHPIRTPVSAGAMIWVLGFAALLLYALISYLRLRRDVRTAVRLHPGDYFKNSKGTGLRVCPSVWQSDRIASPFVLGFVRPRIYLPFTLKETEMEFVFDHELAHIARKDHWLKPFGFLLLSLYWFNPVMWFSYILFCRDIELACDERVIRQLSPSRRADYSQSLLSCSAPGRAITACPLAFGEVGVKERVKQVLNYKKPAFWVILLVVAAGIALAVFFLTNPPKKDPNKDPKASLTDPSNQGTQKDPGSSSTNPSNGDSHKETEETRSALQDIPENYALEQAVKDGCVVFDGLTLIDGETVWADFMDRIAMGQKATVRIYQSYSDRRSHPVVQELSSDGEKYLLQFYRRNEVSGGRSLFSKHFRYLKCERFALGTSPETGQMEICLLSDSPEVTAKGYMENMLSSVYHPENKIFDRCRSVFIRSIHADNSLESCYGSAFADIDNDGKVEECLLGDGPTSGIYSYTLSVYEDGKPKYKEVYTAIDAPRILQTADGSLKILACSIQSMSDQPQLYDIVARDGKLILVRDGEEIFPQGHIVDGKYVLYKQLENEVH